MNFGGKSIRTLDGYATTDIEYWWKRDLPSNGQVEFDGTKLKLPQFKILSATPHRRLEGTGTGKCVCIIYRTVMYIVHDGRIC